MGKKIDLIGQVFGNLTVIKDSKKRTNNGGVIWTCECICGTIKDIPGDHLKRGSVKSCGQCGSIQRKINEIGNQYGKLKVIAEAPSREGRAYWLCECECGNIKEISGTNLRVYGHIGCGCGQITDRIGKKYGLLTVIKQLPENNWECKCECGNITIAHGSQLNKNHKLSCGCLKSKGEATIIKILEKLNKTFIQEKTFETCVFPNSQAKARFDFYLPNDNLIIEYDGEQHYFGWNGKENLKEIQQKDTFKTAWCEKNGIKMLRIPFFKYDQIENILIAELG